MSEIKKFIFPAAVVLLGFAMIIYANVTEQNGAYILGSFAILLAGLVSFVAAFVQLSKMLRTAISVGLTVIVLGLTYADYMSIKVPIEFQEEKERRYTHVIQRLKDIRTAELAYKAIYQKYMETLIHWSILSSMTPFHSSRLLVKFPIPCHWIKPSRKESFQEIPTIRQYSTASSEEITMIECTTSTPTHSWWCPSQEA